MNIETNPQTLFSGVQPSGTLHIGNYIGAISQWLEMQKNYNCIFCVVDYHSITVPQDPKVLRQKIIEITKIYLASGIDPDRATIFLQSDISAHAELTWLLNCTSARTGDLSKMIQFKEKAKNKKQNVSIGLYDYPVLMASDILLYDTDVVPVGEDQVQHVELTRDLAQRFNRDYGEIFKIPEILVKEEGARIMGLDDPNKKMSKSADNELNYISLIEDPQKAAKKIKKATTDSGAEIKYNPKKKPGISNLLVIYSLLAERSIQELEKQYQNRGYGEFKKDLGEVVKNFLTDFQKKYNQITNSQVKQILRDGADKVKPQAEKKLEQARKKVGTYLK